MKEILKAIEEMTNAMEQERVAISNDDIAKAANEKLEKLRLLLLPYKTILDQLPRRNDCRNKIDVDIGILDGYTLWLTMTDDKKHFYFYSQSKRYVPFVKDNDPSYMSVKKFCIDNPIVQNLNFPNILENVKKRLMEHINAVKNSSINRMNARIKALEAFNVNISVEQTFDNLLDLLIETNEQFKESNNEELMQVISSVIDSIKEVRKEVN